ncbi:MAG TPA: class I SAM-dependent methyltransferase [Nitrospiraceae bacterium]|nr:class I SAM-dependent methyltransferase [Nitrospiraceae bacterium]
MQSPKTFLAVDRPDLVEYWRTTEDRYYAKHGDKTANSLRSGPLDQEYVCDRYGNLLELPIVLYADEVLLRQTFEHLSLTEARRALREIRALLGPGGIVRIDVPDHEETLRLYRETGDYFYVRHLLGPRRTEFGFHMMSYTRDRLTALVESHGFRRIGEEPNIHFYPAFCLRFERI